MNELERQKEQQKTFEFLNTTEWRHRLGYIQNNDPDITKALEIMKEFTTQLWYDYNKYVESVPASEVCVKTEYGMWGWTNYYADGHDEYWSIGD